MDSLYSLLLFVASCAAAAGLALAALGLPITRRLFDRWSRPGSARRARLEASSAPCLAVGAGCLTLSVAVHWYGGHGKTSLEPMGVETFLNAHRAFVVVFFLLIAGAVLATAGRRSGSD